MILSELIIKLKNRFESYGLEISDIHKVITYLVKYGYLTHIDKLEDIVQVIQAIKSFQSVAGLETDGEIGPKTLRATSWPRCAMPDVYYRQEDPNRVLESKWGTGNLTYYIESRDNDLSAAQWDNTIEMAFKQWSEVANVKFTRTNNASNANFILGVGSGRQHNFDGSGGTLAWHQLPYGNNYNGRLRGMFDAAETWIVDSTQRGIYLLNVACHEIGHGLGLEHSKVSSALMAPFYSASIPKPQQNNDITRIQKLYGPPTNIPTDPKPNPEVLPAPTNLAAELVGVDRVRLSWQDNSLGEDGFQIYRNDKYQGMVARGTRAAIDADVPNGSHTYGVRAIKGEVTSDMALVSITVGDNQPTDPQPDVLHIKITGNVEGIEIPGYRINKLG